MASSKGRIIRLLSGIALSRATVLKSQSIGNYQRLLLQCKVPKLRAGMKVQLLLPSNEVRTYSPIPAPEGMELLAWKHLNGPGAEWMRTVRSGEELPFVGPQRSLEMEPGRMILIGDETSVAVAAAFSIERPGMVTAIIETDSPADTLQAATLAGMGPIQVFERGNHRGIAAATLSVLTRHPNAAIGLTGGAENIVNVRQHLRGSIPSAIKVKTHWIAGREGLD